MEKTLFPEYVQWFKKLVGKVTETINGQKTENELLYKRMLTDEYSADLTWDSANVGNSIVAADVIAMDSSLPLKKRPSFSVASGKVPKIGLKFRKGEKEISDIQIMEARGANEADIVSKIFNDIPRVIKGVEYRKEIMFLQALSTGATMIEDGTDENTGTAIRVSFGFKDENSFVADIPWSNAATATPITDLQKIFEKADDDGNSIVELLMSKAYFNYLRNCKDTKVFVANYLGTVYTSVDNLPKPSKQSLSEAFQSEYGCKLTVVNNSFRVERPDGSYNTINPWDAGAVVGVPAEKVGRLFWSTLVEEARPVANVTYEKSDHTLIAKYSKTDPYEEFTTGQSLEMPVIDEAPNIYILHADRTAEIVIDDAAMTFDKSASSKSTAVSADGELSAASNQSWATASIKGGKVVVKVAANSTGSQRTATVTVSDESGDTATIAVTQTA